jgi:hypothetical protein
MCMLVQTAVDVERDEEIFVRYGDVGPGPTENDLQACFCTSCEQKRREVCTGC